MPKHPDARSAQPASPSLLPLSSPRRLDGRMMPLLLGYNAMVSSKACCCLYASMLGLSCMSPKPVSCLVGFSRRHPVVLLFPSQCRFCHCCSCCPHICPVLVSLSLALSLPFSVQMRFTFPLILSPPPPNPSLVICLNDLHNCFCQGIISRTQCMCARS